MAKQKPQKKAPKVAETAPKVLAMPFGKKNYRFMLVGLGLLALGFIIMAVESEPYGFGFLGLTLGPVLLMAGFIFEVVAILIKPEDSDPADTGS